VSVAREPDATDPAALEQISEHLYCLRDTCNVYLLVDGERGLVIDAGSGAIADRLGQVGVDRLEWVLHTHHHRDQCWGTPRLKALGARVAVPEYERHLFDAAEAYWQTRRTFDNYDNRNTFFTSGVDIPVDGVLEDYDKFVWRSYEFEVLPAKGHTLGSSCLIAEIDGRRMAFTGDLLGPGGKLYQLHAMEYIYGGLEGLMFTMQSIRALDRRRIDLGLPSHGDPVEDPAGDIRRLERRLTRAAELGRGLAIAPATPVPETAYLPEPKLDPISQHLLWGGIWTCSNFYVLLSDSGKALFIDYGHAYTPHMHIGADHEGLESMRFVEHHLDELFEEHGVRSIDLVIPTHIHDDHTCGIPYLQRHHGVSCWALDVVAQVLEDPAAWASTPCAFPKPIRIDRRLADGERFQWEEYELQIFHAPGQTEFASIITGMIDGRKVAFTGDNYFLHEVARSGKTEKLPYQTTVMRNSFQLWMHRRCAELMRLEAPELICPGHDQVLPCHKEDIDAYTDFIARKEAVFRDLVDEPADHFIDLFWVRLLPYVTRVRGGDSVTYQVLARNNLERRAVFGARLVPPPGWSATGQYGTVGLEPDGRGEIRLSMTVPRDVARRRYLVTADITVDGESQGPVPEAVVIVDSEGVRA
jgi:glyoxylase-like metal-dependent hydrolase (beta-lactamase superfamily II)